MSDEFLDLPKEVKDAYVAIRQLPDGTWIGVHRLLYHWTLHTGIDYIGYSDRWCIDTFEHAMEAFNAFDGTGPALHWHKHPKSGMRRNTKTGVEWHEDDVEPLT